MRSTLHPLLLAARLALAAAPALALAAPAPDASLQLRTPGSGVEVWGILGGGDLAWGGGGGLGVGYHTPLVPGGLLHGSGSGIRDSLDLDVGLDWLIGHHWNPDFGWSFVDLHAGIRWDLWLTPQLAVYPKAGLGVSFGDRRVMDGVYPEIALGGALKVRQDLTLRAEIGWVGLKLGLGFEF
jgi:hypothetical protein